MSKRRILAAAKRKGLEIENLFYGDMPSLGEHCFVWEIIISGKSADHFGEQEQQSFDRSAEAVEWINALQPLEAQGGGA